MRYVAIFEHATVDFDLSRDPQLLLCRDGKAEPVALPNLSGYDMQARHFMNAIDTNEMPSATLEQAAIVAEILDAERESVLTGNRIELK